MSERAPQSAANRESIESTLSIAEKEAIWEMAYPVQRILNQLAPELEEGAYKMIIGDDVSGRIPAIVVNEAITKIYKAYGHKAPMLRFVAGGKREHELPHMESTRTEDMRTRVMGMNEELMRAGDAPRALLVTEAVSTGEAMRMVTRALNNERIKTDVAALGFIGAKYYVQNLTEVEAKLSGARLIYGTENLPSIYGDRNLRLLQGVAKEHGSSTSSRLTDHEIHRDDVPYIQAKVNAARVLAIKVGSDVASTYLADKQQKAA